MCDSRNNKTFQSELESVTEFLERFKVQNFKLLIDNKDDKHKAMLLANALPVDVLTDIQRRLKPTKLSDATYAQIESHLTSLHSVKKSIIGASVAFLHRKQQPNESIENFAKHLNELASQCDYEECCRDRMLRDVFVSGLKNAKIMSTLILEIETKKFHEMLEKAKLIEQLQVDVAEINPTAKPYQQNNVYDNKFRQNSSNSTTMQAAETTNSRSSKQKTKQKISDNYICYRCGIAGSHLAHDCYAIKTKCSKCHRLGHLSKMCRTNKPAENKSDTKLNCVYDKEEEEDPCKYVTMYNIKKSSAVEVSATTSQLDTRDQEVSLSDKEVIHPDKEITFYRHGDDSKLKSAVQQVVEVRIECKNKYEALVYDEDSDLSEYASCEDEEEDFVSSINSASHVNKKRAHSKNDNNTPFLG